VFEIWVAPCRLVDAGEQWQLIAPRRLIRDMLIDKYLTTIERTLGREVRIEMEVPATSKQPTALAPVEVDGPPHDERRRSA
jgi:chromosomal replication initiation ATPase DnaA